MANLWPGTISEAQLKGRGEPRAAADASTGQANGLVEPSSPAAARLPVHPAADLEPEVAGNDRAGEQEPEHGHDNREDDDHRREIDAGRSGPIASVLVDRRAAWIEWIRERSVSLERLTYQCGINS